jgi:hypothetical protein
MDHPLKYRIPYEEIDNGALILLLLREVKTWEELCARYDYTDPTQLQTNTSTMTLRDKLLEMRALNLLSFQDEETEQGKKPVGEIKATDLWAKIRVACGGMSLSEAALLSRHSKGMAIVPEFGRPKPPEEKIDVFVLMPFKAKMAEVYASHIKKLGEELGVTIRRADDRYSPRPFMEKVWSGICAAQLILADCTEENPNVFYEIGIAHTVGKRVVLITRSEKDIPSDIQHFERITYDVEGVETLVDRLRAVLKSNLGIT